MSLRNPVEATAMLQSIGVPCVSALVLSLLFLGSTVAARQCNAWSILWLGTISLAWLGLAWTFGFLLLIWPLSIVIGLGVAKLMQPLMKRQAMSRRSSMEASVTASAIYIGLVLAYYPHYRNPHVGSPDYVFWCVSFFAVSFASAVVGFLVTASVSGTHFIKWWNVVKLASLQWGLSAAVAWIAFVADAMILNRGHMMVWVMGLLGLFIVPFVAVVCGVVYGLIVASFREWIWPRGQFA